MTYLPSAFLMHPSSSLHDTGWGHPEHQGRLRSLASALAGDMPALQGSVESVQPEEVGEDALLRVHTPEHAASSRAERQVKTSESSSSPTSESAAAVARLRASARVHAPMA